MSEASVTLRRWRDPKAWADAAYDPKTRGLILQGLLVLLLVWLLTEAVLNTAANLKKQNIASGFSFLWRTSGFDISQTLIPYSAKSRYFDAFLAGLGNTLIVSVLGIVFATVLGFGLGFARLSSNWLVSRLALLYVELVRNVPLLLQLLVWYVAVLRALPAPQESLSLFGKGFLDVRGLHLPLLAFPGGSAWIWLALFGSAVGAAFFVSFARRLKRETGRDMPAALFSAGLFALLLLLGLLAAGVPSLSLPVLGRYNFDGGLTIEPEFMALLVGLTTYTAAFIAEIVRSGIQGVPRGQWEAAQSLGLQRRDTLRLVIVPQAMRIIVPPLTNQYLNLTKNSSLAVAIGYPDLVSVFSGTVLNQTGQAVEVILITMGVFLTLSLLTSGFMNWFNRRMALPER